MQGSEFKTWVQSFASCWQQCRGKHAQGPRALCNTTNTSRVFWSGTDRLWRPHADLLQLEGRQLNRREAKGRREGPFNSLAQYPGELQLENCILGALGATLPCGGEFHGNFCRGFKLQRGKKKPLRCSLKHQTKRLYAPETLKFL